MTNMFIPYAFNKETEFYLFKCSCVEFISSHLNNTCEIDGAKAVVYINWSFILK